MLTFTDQSRGLILAFAHRPGYATTSHRIGYFSRRSIQIYSSGEIPEAPADCGDRKRPSAKEAHGGSFRTGEAGPFGSANSEH